MIFWKLKFLAPISAKNQKFRKSGAYRPYNIGAPLQYSEFNGFGRRRAWPITFRQRHYLIGQVDYDQSYCDRGAI